MKLLLLLLMMTGVYKIASAQIPADTLLHPAIVSREASFPGGIDSLTKYISGKMDFRAGTDNKIPTGYYRLIANLVIDETGKVQSCKVENNAGYGLERQLCNILRYGPAWLPAFRNSKAVVGKPRLPVMIKVD